MSIRETLRFWMTLDRQVDRRTYLFHGLALAGLKYGVDAALVGLATGTLWTPWSYLMSAPVLLSSRFADAPGYLAPVLVVWTLPFLWIGVSMTLRRSLDAGWSAWLSLLFFVPIASYLLIASLCVAPGSERASAGATAEPAGSRLPSALLSIAFGSLLGLAMMWLSVLMLNSYGLALFMGTPFAVGVTTSFVLCRRYPATNRETLEVVTMTSFVIAGAAFALGTEGVVCLLMLLPLGLVLALLGGILGRRIARHDPRSVRGATMALLLLPTATVIEGGPAVESLRAVRTSIEIEAPTSEVWERVIAFPELAEPTALIFQLGVAYPTHAEIKGSGVGAIRYCVFSTGAFVEPITAWEPGRRLAFDVTESPPPLRELSPYRTAPPHLEGYLAPRRGEFLLEALPEGRTRLIGTTWYEQRLEPEGYWALFSDVIIKKIHTRVLEHIKMVSEG